MSLGEVGRYSLESVRPGVTKPYGLAASADGDLYVSLFDGQAILRLDGRGDVVECIADAENCELGAPAGIVLDTSGRLWVVDCLKSKVFILDRAHASIHVVGGVETQVGSLRCPVGICAAANGSMLVADTGNHRLIEVSPEGECKVFCGGLGKRPGELRQPNSLCLGRGAGDQSIWVVDHRNHRLQRFNSGGMFLQLVGGCGLGRGQLYYPESVAEFPDGTVVVAQGHLNRCLKLFSPNGEELESAALDYAPGSMLAYEDLLLVAEFDGNAIRIYERRR